MSALRSVADHEDARGRFNNVVGDRLELVDFEDSCDPLTGRALTKGTLAADENLEFVVASDNLVLFGDGMESDHLTVGWGQRVIVRASSRVLYLA